MPYLNRTSSLPHILSLFIHAFRDISWLILFICNVFLIYLCTWVGGRDGWHGLYGPTIINQGSQRVHPCIQVGHSYVYSNVFLVYLTF